MSGSHHYRRNSKADSVPERQGCLYSCVSFRTFDNVTNPSQGEGLAPLYEVR